MQLSRRDFTGGALGLALAPQFGGAALAQPAGNAARAVDAVRAYAEAHLAHFGLPGMTLGLIAPAGFNAVLNLGFANTASRQPFGDDTLVQIGSITKAMTAAVIYQLAAEGRLRLSDSVAAVVPEIPLAPGAAFTIQHLLNHTSGLPANVPTFAEDGLATGFSAGEHWHYSNTGYDILGRIAEKAAGKPLARLFEQRLFMPLGMAASKGAITAADRLLYAQGYDAADPALPFVRGSPLAPASWVEMTSGGGSVGSTAADMTLFLRSLANLAQGRGGLGLSSSTAFLAGAVRSDTAGMTYANGLMQVREGARRYLHHTGGMVSFSSSFHLDVASGTGAFASSNIGIFAEYRPRALTRFAADALTAALAGRAIPTPPPLETPVANARQYLGRYSGPGGEFEIRAGSPLTLVADGREASLQPWNGDLFRTAHPRFRQFTLKFERSRGTISGASWGPSPFVKQGSGAALPASDPALARLAGRYVNDSPWWGTLMVVERGGRLWVGTEVPMTRIGDNLWRVGAERWSPERASFAHPIDGRPQTFLYSGETFTRREV